MRKVLLAMSLFAVSAFAVELTGVVSEDHCGAKHSAGSAADQKCVEGCVKKGGKPVLVSEGKVYKIDDPSKVMDHLGHKVVVKGDVEGDNLKIDSVEMAK
jgi:Protein of unknown function (DUF5818)